MLDTKERSAICVLESFGARQHRILQRASQRLWWIEKGLHVEMNMVLHVEREWCIPRK